MVLLDYRGGFSMAKNKHLKNTLIHDDGTAYNLKTTQATIFIALCRILSVLLIILGAAAFYYGNF